VIFGTADRYLGIFLFSIIAVLFISLFVGTARRRRLQRHATGQAQGVEFQAPSPGKPKDRRGVQMRALLLVGYAAWAAVLGVRGEPVLGPLAAVILLEFALAYFRAARIMGGVVSDEAVAARVGPVVADLCGRAGCAVPRVMLRDDSVRVAGVRRMNGRMTIVLSRPFVERVSDPELTALLAHEVVHIARGDLDAARGRATVAVFGLGRMITSVVESPLNRSREERADREGAQLSGDPRALARALAAAHAVTQEMRSRLYGRAPWSWLLAPESWRLPTHPPMARRIARLEAMVESRQGSSSRRSASSRRHPGDARGFSRLTCNPGAPRSVR
jgi:heat shock protein HtpX